MSYGQPIDFIIVIVYFVAILAFGAMFGSKNKTTKEYFFSGRRFSWWLIAASCIATVVGSYSFIKYSAAGFSFGLSSSMTYLNDWFLIPLFMFGWMPIIYFSRVQSIPEYFERRFNRSVRYIAMVFILVYLVGYIGINLYTLGVALNAIMPSLTTFEWACLIAGVTAVYVTFGGQTAVIMTDLVQGAMFVAAGLVLFGLGIWYLGQNNGQGLSGWGAFWHGLPTEHRLPFSGLVEPADFPMAGIFWQDVFGSSMFFYFANQGLIMRFMAVKSMNEGRKAIVVVALVLMPLAVLAVGNAGWVGRSLATFGLIPADTDPNTVFMAVTELVTTPGVFGLILAALIAALMSTVDTLINSVAAIAVNDIYKPLIASNKPDKHYLRVAQVRSVVFTLAGVLLVPLFMSFESIYVAHGSFTAAISPPMIVVVILGILWRRFSTAGAVATLVAGGAAVLLSLWYPSVIDPLAWLHGMEPGQGYNYLRSLYGILACSAAGIGASIVWPNKNPEKLRGLWIGAVHEAKRLFKGSEPNEAAPVTKVRLTLVEGLDSGHDLDATPDIVFSAADAVLLNANHGDMVYVADRRWWLGGLHSLHGRLSVQSIPEGTVIIPKDHLPVSGLHPGRIVIAERIM